jgi:hypothetical protein
MAIALVTHQSFAGGASGGTTASGVDTTGANLILVVVGAYQGSGSGALQSVTDNKSNTYTRRTFLKTSVTGYQIELWECLNPTVGSGHTFTQNTSNGFNSFCVGAFSGVATSSAFGASVTAEIASGTSTQQAGSLTPSANGALFISGLLLNDSMAGTVSINSSLTITDQVAHGANNEGSALAYIVQGTAGALNPTWSGQSTGSFETAVLNAWYLAAATASTPWQSLVQDNQPLIERRIPVAA